MNLAIKVAVLVTDEKNEKILLIKEKLETKTKSLWNVIKGSFEGFSKETLVQAAVRECFEEADVTVKITNSMGIYFMLSKGKTRIQFNFLAKILTGVPRVPPIKGQKDRGEDIQDVRWFTQKEVMNLKVSDFVSRRAYQLVQDWLAGKKYPLRVIRGIPQPGLNKKLL